MQYQIDNFKVLVSDNTPLKTLVKKRFKLNDFGMKIISKSIDARKKEFVLYVYRLLIMTDQILEGKDISPYQSKMPKLNYPKWKNSFRPVIVGFGPAGIFSSLYLARCGAKPIIIERGSKIDKRVEEVNDFFNNKKLTLDSNVQFGEGGAGTFSDGKLTTNLKNPLINFILAEFYKHGAKEDIMYEAMPHIGTDILREVVKNIRAEIEKLGGEFYFNTTFDGCRKKDNYLEVTASDLSFKTQHLILGIGHSAKDTIRMLYNDVKLNMEPKAFSMGVRIEQDAKKISYSQYGKYARYLPKAYYKLACHKDDRGIYTFCMCPGGYVLASTSNENTIVTNGMSNQKREGVNSNSAILVDVKPSDYGQDVLKGLEYQEKYEKLAFNIGNDYRAPANLVYEFLHNKVAKEQRSIKTTYPHGLIMANLNKCLPDYVIKGIKDGLNIFDRKIKGFADPDAILIGIESRSSSPVRITRDENRMASLEYIYPVGEGAGYAGGITSASLDGLLTAMKISQEEI